MKKSIALILITSFIQLNAKTTVSSLEELMVKSRSIVIGTYMGEYVPGKSYHIDVDTTVKGAPKSGVISVGKANGIPRILPGTKCMAFINNQNQWEWLGISKDFRKGVIHLKGIADYGNSIVYPSALSLAQLTDFMKFGQFSGAIEGNLRFWSVDKLTFENSNSFFAVVYTYFNRDSVTTRSLAGGLKTGTFGNNPEVYFEGATVILTYSDNEFRPLQIGGRVDSLKPNGHDFVADFQVWQPQSLSMNQFELYVADVQLGPLYYDLSIEHGAEKYPFTFGEEDGQIGYMVFNGKELSCYQSAVPTDDQSGVLKFGTWSHPEMEIVLNMIPESIDYDNIRAMSGDRFINILRFIPITGEMFVYENGQKVSKGTCVISITRTKFLKNLSVSE